MLIRILVFAFLSFSSVCLSTVEAEEVRIAVASNFLSTLQELISGFEQDSGHTAVVSSGSSGKIYAQIVHGAPFDVFLSADNERPKRLEEDGLVVAGSRFVYAIGRLTLWSPDTSIVLDEGPAILAQGRFQHLAIANPRTAPYGKAAEQTLKNLGLWESLHSRIVQGENIGQTFQFVFSQNAQLGFVALSQVLDPKIHGSGSRWDVPPALHDALQQEAVLLLPGKSNAAGRAFIAYIQGPKGRTIIERFGYGLPS